MDLIWLIPFCVGAYLLGNLNFAIIAAKFKKVDIRKVGSGNPGATNTLRALGTKWAIIVLALDMIKGVIPAIIGFAVFGWGINGVIGLYSMGLSTVLGHCYPAVYRFRGGKGVATLMGVFIVADPMWGPIAFAVALVYGIIWEYGAVASFLFVTIMVVSQAMTYGESMAICFLLFSYYLLVCFTHRKNIFRLLTGGESRASLLKKIKQRALSKQQEKWAAEV